MTTCDVAFGNVHGRPGAPDGFNARCDFPIGHSGPHELVIEFHPDCKTCRREPHDLHKRELLLPPGYIECADCTAVTEVLPAFVKLSHIKYRKKLCSDCYELARETRGAVGSAIHASLVTADPSTLVAMSGGTVVASGTPGYARAAKSFADNFARPIKPGSLKPGDVVTFSWTGEDDGGLWVHGSPADG